MWPAPSDDLQKPPSSPKLGRRPLPIPHQQSSEPQQQQSSASEARRTTWRSTASDMQGVDSPISGPSDSKFGQLSPSATDRVFPIRSVVSIDPRHIPTTRTSTTGGDGFPGTIPPRDENTEPRDDPQYFSVGSSVSLEPALGTRPVDSVSNRQQDTGTDKTHERLHQKTAHRTLQQQTIDKGAFRGT